MQKFSQKELIEKLFDKLNYGNEKKLQELEKQSISNDNTLKHIKIQIQEINKKISSLSSLDFQNNYVRKSKVDDFKDFFDKIVLNSSKIPAKKYPSSNNVSFESQNKKEIKKKILPIQDTKKNNSKMKKDFKILQKPANKTKQPTVQNKIQSKNSMNSTSDTIVFNINNNFTNSHEKNHHDEENERTQLPQKTQYPNIENDDTL